MKTPEILEVLIEKIVPDGFGLAHAQNLTIFVPLVAAGDRARVRIERKKGKVAFAEVVEILEPSADRVKPPCPHFGVCGGCDFQQLNYTAQLRAKVEIIRDCLRRIGKIDWQREIEIAASPNDWNYRTRAQWKRDGKKIGYFERKSHRVCDVVVCPILTETLQKTLHSTRENSDWNFVELRAAASGETVSLSFANSKTDAEPDENFYAANKIEEENDRIDASPRKSKAEEISLRIGDLDYSFSADVFFQVNHGLLREFVETAIGEAHGDQALDLYCGVGLFTLPLAAKFKKVFGIEGNRLSIQFAKSNALSADLKNVDFEVSAVGKWLAENEEKLAETDFVLLDPPRSGAEAETINTLIRLRPLKIVYVSCNPATLARDLRALMAGGYEIENIRAFDFFPQTHHVETVVHLSSKVS
ncbi:MAG: 23S rRNA (uracil(1939)-C(5))-methyltransferase RlmD [Acidobacteriota bacterium]|nr:23S rRNA (uracil(1939)-C(5))-methyltransferase RlmD [Acidobacteriota bacterium]